MTYPMILIVAGMLVGAGVFLIVRALVPTNPALLGALDRLSPDQASRPTIAPEPVNPRDIRDQLGALLERRVSGRRGFSPPLTDLAVLGRTVRWYWGEKGAVTALVMLSAITLQVLVTIAQDFLPFSIPFSISGVAVIGLAAGAWFLTDYDIRQQARRARREIVRAAISYCQQVAIHRRAESTSTGAMREAAQISDGWMFLRIREELHRAQITGAPAWEGLELLAARTGTPELAEVGDIMRLAGDSGAAVYETLQARAKALNDALLAAEHREALKAAQTIDGPVGLLPGILVLLILYPALITLAAT